MKDEYTGYLKAKVRGANILAAVIAFLFLCAGTLFIVLYCLRPGFGVGFLIVGVVMLAFIAVTFFVRARYVRFLKRALATSELERSFVPNRKSDRG